MSKKRKGAAVLLALVLILGLLPVTALALEAGEEEALINGPEESLYAESGSRVYNNGGTVYNNGGTVYNNAGTVYNNAGTVYNNAGTVYANGGTVYNNNGTVYNNSAAVNGSGAPEETPAPSAGPEPTETPVPSAEPEPTETPAPSAEPEPEESAAGASRRVTFAEDYSSFVDPEGLEEAADGESWSLQGPRCVLRPLEGYRIQGAEASAGEILPEEDGSYTFTPGEEEALLTLHIATDTPVFSLQPGTYAENQYLELTGPEGAAFYFTDDGSAPEPGRGRYTGPIAIRGGVEIRALAQAEGTLPSAEIRGSYAVVSVTGPVFDPVEEGYTPVTQGVTVKNSGSTEAKVSKAALSGADAKQFILGHSSGRSIPAGATVDNYWTLRPVNGLKAGTYTALLTLTLDSGETVELDVNFTVTAPEK